MTALRGAASQGNLPAPTLNQAADRIATIHPNSDHPPTSTTASGEIIARAPSPTAAAKNTLGLRSRGI